MRASGPPPWVLSVTLMAGIVIFGALMMLELRRDQRAARADARAWTITGPPCAALTPEGYRKARFTTRSRFDYAGVLFGRFAGHVSCAEISATGDLGGRRMVVCQFSSPVVLTVRTARGMFLFAPGIGRPATVTVDREAPRCVVAAKFTP